MIKYWLLALCIAGQAAWSQDIDTPRTRHVSVEYTFDRSDIATKQYESVCRVVCELGGGQQATGTGVYLSNGWVLTAKHVVEDGRNINCEFRQQRIRVKRHYTDKYDHDVALLKLESNPDVPEQQLAESPASVGDYVYLAGFDRGDPNALRIYDGQVYEQNGSGRLGIRGVDSRISINGNSGGPVWNDSGNVTTCISTRCPPGTPIRDGNGRVVDRVQVGTTGTPSTTPVIDFCRRVWQQTGEEETGEQIIRWGRRGCGPNGVCPPEQRPMPNPPPSPQPPQQDCPSCSPGERGPAGPPGRDGKDAQVTQQQLDQIANAVTERLRNDPSLKGPPGEPCESSECYRRVVLVDGASGVVIDDETYGPDEPIVLDVQNIINATKQQ